jgi:hypothetical protein
LLLLQSIVLDVIDIDDGEDDDDDLMVIGQISRKCNKGKALEAIHEDVLGKTGVLKSSRRKRAAAPGLTITDEPENETLRKLRSFKKFDTVTDTSDHHFIKSNSSMKQVSFFFFF